MEKSKIMVSSLPDWKYKRSQKPPIFEELLQLFRIFNTIMGLPVFVLAENMRAGLLPYAFFLYQHFTEAVVTVGVFGQFWAMPHIMGDMNVLCACLASGTHSLQVVVKTALIHLFLKQKILKHIAATNEALLERAKLEQRVSNLASVENFKSYFMHQTRFVRIILVVFFSMMAASTTFYFIPIDVDSILRRNDLEGQLTPIVFYFHWDFMYTPAFQIVNVFLTLCFYFVNIKTVVFDSFFLAYIVFHTVQFRYLKLLLDAILLQTDKGYENNGKDRDILKLWFKHHQVQLGLTYDFMKIMSPFLLIEFAYVFIHTCVPAFVITSTSTWTASQKFGVCFIAGAGLVQLLFMSRAGDLLTDAIANVSHSLYRHKIFKEKEGWQCFAFKMAAIRAKVPIKLRAARIFPLCCPTFLTISRLILSYYMTLNEVQRMKAHNN